MLIFLQQLCVNTPGTILSFEIFFFFLKTLLIFFFFHEFTKFHEKDSSSAIFVYLVHVVSLRSVTRFVSRFRKFEGNI